MISSLIQDSGSKETPPVQNSPFARHLEAVDDAVDRLKLVRGELDLCAHGVLSDPGGLRRAWDGDDVLALAENPGNGDLAARVALLLADLGRGSGR